jgi:hypothetical protein
MWVSAASQPASSTGPAASTCADVPVDISPLELVASLGLAVTLAASAGLRAWLPLLVTGGLARAGLVQVGESFQLLSSTPVLIALGVATIIEVLGDKVPAVDHALDVVSTFTRPLAGVLVSASVMWQVSDPMVALGVGLLVGAPAAAVPHALKSGARLASTATTGGLANPVVSVIEDGVSIGMVILAIVVPILAGFAVLVAGIVAFRFWRRRRLARAQPTP